MRSSLKQKNTRRVVNQKMETADQCRFCLDTEGTEENPLIIPCECKGSIRYVHQRCLDKWRLTEPDRNGFICRLCDSVYIFPLHVLFEEIPDPNTWSFFLLRFPIVISLIAHYIVLLVLMTTVPMTMEELFSILDYSQFLFHIFFCFLFVRRFSVRNKRLYFQRWLQLPTVVLPFAHVFFFFIRDENRVISFLVLNTFPMMYWTHHILFLQEINKQLLEA